MKNLALSLVVAVFMLGLCRTASAAEPAHEGIAAIVNDSVITLSDIKDRADLYLSGTPKPTSPEQRREVERQVLNRLIDESLQMQEARKLGISVDEAAVTAGFANIAGQNKLPADEFKKNLIAQGMPLETLYTQIRADIAWSQVVRRKLRPEVDISDNEIDQTLDQLAHGRSKTQYLVAEIFLRVPDPAKDAEVRAVSEGFVKQLGGGASFVTIARQFSQAPGAATGGDLGWIQEGQLDPELDKVLKKMQPGQISPPIRSDKGYHIVFLREVRAGKDPETAADAKSAPDTASGDTVSLKQIVIPLAPQDPETVVAAKMARGQSLKDEIGSCDDMAAKTKDFPASGTGDLGTSPEAALPKELRAIVSGLKTGELSAPIRGPEGIAMVMVCARETAAKQETPASRPGAEMNPGILLPNIGLEKTDKAEREKIAGKLGMERLNQKIGRAHV